MSENLQISNLVHYAIDANNITTAKTELKKDQCLLLFRLFLALFALWYLVERHGGRCEEVSRQSVGTFSQFIAESCSCFH